MIINNKTSKLTFNFIVIGAIFLILGIVAVLKLEWFGLIFIFISAAIFSVVFGFQINKETMKMRNYIQIFWIKLGKWQSIKNINYFSIVKIKRTYNVGLLSIAGKRKTTLYKLNIVLNNKKIIPLHSGSQKEIKKIAKQLSEQLQIEIKGTAINSN